jgi:hypothetical protein
MAIQIITTSLPNGIDDVAYSQTVQTFGGEAPLTFSVSSGTLPTGLSINASTGVISGTPTTPGSYSFVIEVEDYNAATDTQSYSVAVYAALNTSPDPIDPATTVVVEAGNQVTFSATGGSGNYLWTVDGGNLINPLTGLLTAINGGNYTVTCTDQESGQIATVAITVTSQSQFCVTGEAAEALTNSSADACCEFNVECGDRLQLRIPSFHVMENGDKQAVVYENLVQAVTGEAGALRSTAAVAGASGNAVSFNRDAYYEIITSEDMADTAVGEVAIGWSPYDIDSTVASITHAVVWFTESATRYVEIRHNGVAEADTRFEIAEGDAVTFGMINGSPQLWINSVLQATSVEDFAACGEVVLDVAIEDSGVAIGGYVSGLTWTVATAGSAATVGAIDADGIYTSPSSPLAGIIQVVGTVGTANFYVNIRNIQPTPKFIKPQPFLAGRRAHVWVTNKRATDTELIRIASDGSPDAIQNPGMIYLGVLEGSAKFTEDNQTQDFSNDEGIYDTVITEERATLTGTFLEVRDLDKLAVMMQHATLYPTSKGVRELGVGGKGSRKCDLRAVIVVESGAGGAGWDVIYLPRVQNTANLDLEIGKKTNAKYELNFRVLPDVTRPSGKQLYSIYQMENCTGVDSGATCG